MNALTISVRPAAAPALRIVLRACGFAGIGALALAAGLSGVIARAPAGKTGIDTPLSPPSPDHPFGTDLLGRDVMSETLHALAVSFADAGIALGVVLVAGGFAGFVLARAPLALRAVTRWAAGVLAACPALLLAIVFAALLGRPAAALAAGLAVAPRGFLRAFDRARALHNAPHAEFARATGISAGQLLRRDFGFEMRDEFLGAAARAFAAVTITLATLSFFGFGASPPERDLGLMIAAARAGFFDAWWTVAFPALALVLSVLFARLAAGLDEGERP